MVFWLIPSRVMSELDWERSKKLFPGWCKAIYINISMKSVLIRDFYSEKDSKNVNILAFTFRSLQIFDCFAATTMMLNQKQLI